MIHPDVALRDAELEDRDRLRQLLADYLFEFDGRTDPYPYLDAYWAEPERLPFSSRSRVRGRAWS